MALDSALDGSLFDVLDDLEGDSTFGLPSSYFDLSTFCVPDDDFARDVNMIFPSFGSDLVSPEADTNMSITLECDPNPSTWVASPTSQKSEEFSAERDNSGGDSQEEGVCLQKKERSKKGSPRDWSSGDSDMRFLAKRRCVDCGEINTPQWRRGPNGPKTLCNACGIRVMRQRLPFQK